MRQYTKPRKSNTFSVVSPYQFLDSNCRHA